MLFCYVSIINTVKRGNALSSEGDLTDRQRKMERDVTIVSVGQLHHHTADLTRIQQALHKANTANRPMCEAVTSILIS